MSPLIPNFTAQPSPAAAAAARAAINRANAQHSTGPKTDEGKARSCRNAVATGLTGKTVLLPEDDLHEYVLHLSRHCAEYLPANDPEAELVQAIADTAWRLRRIEIMEAGFYALGQRRYAEYFHDEAPAARAAMVKAQTFQDYFRQLSNLSLQEGRILRQQAKHVAALQMLQKNRPSAPSPVADVKPEAPAVKAAGSTVASFFQPDQNAAEATDNTAPAHPFGFEPQPPIPGLTASSI